MIAATKLKSFLAGFGFVLFAGMAFAENGELNLSLSHKRTDAKDLQSFMLASNETVASPAKFNLAAAKPASDFKEPWISANKTHQYLGLATLASVIATTMTAPDNENNNSSNQQSKTSGTHQSLGRTTRALALATVATGLLFHWDEMHLFEDGLTDPDTQHWLLGGAGALILANAVGKAPKSTHSGQAELGAGMMLVAIKIVW
jgi:hypothetical protein